VARRLPARDRWYLACGQQNGITAIILAVLLEPVFPGVVAVVAPAILVVAILHDLSNAALDRWLPPSPNIGEHIGTDTAGTDAALTNAALTNAALTGSVVTGRTDNGQVCPALRPVDDANVDRRHRHLPSPVVLGKGSAADPRPQTVEG
jgi:hypothetical protein